MGIESFASSDLSINSFNPDKMIDVSQICSSEFDSEYNIDKPIDVEKKHDIEGFSEYNIDKALEFAEKDVGTSTEERMKFASHSDGQWTGVIGDSKFVPNSDAAKERLADYALENIKYKDGNPDFSRCSETTLKIDDMTSNRINNFRQADIKCADIWNSQKRDGRIDWTPQDIKEWRRENHYSWHERIDMKTMDLVHRDIHEECKHYGGVAECKRREGFGGIFDD